MCIRIVINDKITGIMKTNLVTKKLALSLALFLLYPVSGRADSLILKTGEILRGKLVSQNERSYTFALESGGKEIEVSAERVSIADIDPLSDKALKGSIIFYSKHGSDADSDTEESSNRTYRPIAEAGDSLGGGGTGASIDVLKAAEQTVAMSNTRTDEMQKRLEELKTIADTANQK